ncbi:hypothetical protein MG293_015766 [Ovis ammon polii]|uniref:Uncharacterized protein n=1 Tax=Ovis ammon polii TaxID=230172 RepID=A0AAD4TX19_OVIAM|nr:hypothetical protein MG293_015766 [Ovis ammon polii]
MDEEAQKRKEQDSGMALSPCVGSMPVHSSCDSQTLDHGVVAYKLSCSPRLSEEEAGKRRKKGKKRGMALSQAKHLLHEYELDDETLQKAQLEQHKIFQSFPTSPAPSAPLPPLAMGTKRKVPSIQEQDDLDDDINSIVCDYATQGSVLRHVKCTAPLTGAVAPTEMKHEKDPWIVENEVLISRKSDELERINSVISEPEVGERRAEVPERRLRFLQEFIPCLSAFFPSSHTFEIFLVKTGSLDHISLVSQILFSIVCILAFYRT